MKKIATTAAAAALLLTAACSTGGDSNDAPTTTTTAASASAAAPAAKSWTYQELSAIVTPMGYNCEINSNMICSSPNKETVWQFYRNDDTFAAWRKGVCESGAGASGDVLTNGTTLIYDTTDGQDLAAFGAKLQAAGATGFRVEPNCPK